MEKIKAFFKSLPALFLGLGVKGIAICIAAVLVIAACIATPIIVKKTQKEPTPDTETSVETETDTETDAASDTETDAVSDTDTDTETETDAETDKEKTDTETDKAESKADTTSGNNGGGNSGGSQSSSSNVDVDVDVSISGGGSTSQGNSSSGNSGSQSGNSSSGQSAVRIHCTADALKATEDTSTTWYHYPLMDSTAKDANGWTPTTKGAKFNRAVISKSDMNPGVVVTGDADYSTTIIGYDGFLFCNDTMGDYDGTAQYIPERLEALVGKVVDQKNWIEENGMKLYVVIIPNKNSVYPEYMPEGYTMGETRRIDQVINAMRNKGITVIDGRDSLLAAKNANPEKLLYYKTDTHWNNHGGFEVYTALMNEIKKDYPKAVLHTRNEYQINYEETYMKDQAYYLGYYGSTSEIGPVYTLKSENTADLFSYQNKDKWGQFSFTYTWDDGYSDHLYYFQYINYSNKSAPNMYILRDSYSVALTPFLKDSFYKSTYNWSYRMSKKDILKAKTDVVIIECVEKHIKNMLTEGWGE